MIKKVLAFINRLFNGSYGKTLLGFILLQMTFLVLAIWGPASVKEWINTRRMESVQMALFIICVFVFVSSNTFIFFVELNSLLTGMTPPTNNAKWNLARRWQHQALVLLVGSVVVSVVVTLRTFDSLVAILPLNQWTTPLHLIEGLSIIIFGVFVYVDLKCLEVCKLLLDPDSTLSSSDIDKIKEFESGIKQYLLASDGPGLLGLCVIAIISFVLFPKLNADYWQGFVVGAMGLHMAFSQSTLAFLDARPEK